MPTTDHDPRRREIHHHQGQLLAALAASERSTNRYATDLAYQLAAKTLADLTEAIRRLRGNNPDDQDTEEAAALRSAPVANDDQHGDYCGQEHPPTKPCVGPGFECGYCGAPPASRHTPACTRPDCQDRSAPVANDDRCNACIPPCTNPARCVITR